MTLWTFTTTGKTATIDLNFFEKVEKTIDKYFFVWYTTRNLVKAVTKKVEQESLQRVGIGANR